MSDRIRKAARLAAIACAAALMGAEASAQAPASAGPMVIFDPSMRPMVVDPLAVQMMTGSGMPLTRAEAGMAAAASASRFTGIGSGRASGVRGVAPGRNDPASVRRPSLRSPAGQASVYFNRFGRGTATNVSAPVSAATTRNYYNRPAGFFPAGVR